MKSSFIIHFSEQYPAVRTEERLPQGVSYRIAYAKARSWYINDSWCCMQRRSAKLVFFYYIEVEAKETLYLPVEVVNQNVHWQYALKGGYSLAGSTNKPILGPAQQHQVFGRPGCFTIRLEKGRHLITGFTIGASWLNRYPQLAMLYPDVINQTLIPNILYQCSPATITPLMEAELLLLLNLPEHEHVLQDVGMYLPISRLIDLHLAPTGANSNRPLEEKVEAIRHYIHQRLADNASIPAIQVLAEHFAIDKDYLSRMHKLYYGCCLQEYIHTQKLERAAFMMKRDISVTEVAYLLGYSDIAAFTNAFKRKYGITPSQYKLLSGLVF